MTTRAFLFPKWILVLLAIVTIVRNWIHVVAPDDGAQSIATLALDSVTQNAADALILIFALWGLSQLFQVAFI